MQSSGSEGRVWPVAADADERKISPTIIPRPTVIRRCGSVVFDRQDGNDMTSYRESAESPDKGKGLSLSGKFPNETHQKQISSKSSVASPEAVL